ncbi:MAG: hypothetical protein JWM05_361 [Acidimicrobiales bacterium]|nr:hypothetical protein [Acidimicrobiales bacterium]
MVHHVRRGLELVEASDPIAAVVPLSEGVIHTDHTLRALAANQAAAAMLGWGNELELVHELNRASWSLMPANVRRDMQMTLAVRGRWEGRARLERRDGTRLEATVTACALRGSPGVSAGVVLVIRQISGIARPDQATGHPDSFEVTGLPGRFVLYYQPEIDLRTGIVTSCESLLRWHHPGLGTVSPGAAFADPAWAPRLAPLEVWAVFAACRQAASWAEHGWPMRVTVNLSHQHLNDPELVDRLRRALVVTSVPRSCIAVEMPTSALIQLGDRARRVAADMADEGVSVIVDDVTETVPISAFDEIRPGVIKLDRTMINGLHQSVEKQHRVRRALVLAGSLGAKVTAEAVETADDLAAARDLGCDRAFGYVFSPPQTAEDLGVLCGGMARADRPRSLVEPAATRRRTPQPLVTPTR